MGRIATTRAGGRRAVLRRSVRRARLGQVPPVQAPPRVIATCYLCTQPIFARFKSPDPYSYSVDHIWPLAKNGPDVPANRAPAHRICNLRKGDTLPPPLVMRAVRDRIADEARAVRRVAAAARAIQRVAPPPPPGSLTHALRSMRSGDRLAKRLG